MCTCEKLSHEFGQKGHGCLKVEQLNQCQHYSNCEVTFVELCQIVYTRRRNESYFLFGHKDIKAMQLCFTKTNGSF
jgi:hypothetical protein